MKSQTATPAIFWMLAAFLMLWSLADLVVFVLDVFVNNTSSSGMNMPRWYVIVLAFSVLLSTLSSICLLWRRKSAYLFAILAFIAALIDTSYSQLFITVSMEQNYDWSLLFTVLFLDILLVFFSFYSKQKRWLL
ncbi:hypothetical protein SAMN05192588_2229 [Nonlabens sp. Hel1_33_55]|uniref:hypothetical protein n=1 Tax=Nonlabens sp. Hel1_33_55 TaxID=1336802 RepID=UPI000875D49A|nr:hypothetical protein [Nonlabens sp. Hel1_33_55]SCY31905.1 hypothetical protein SAMN05192588_2229 [Nonlabens sp. Hel1_33_55]